MATVQVIAHPPYHIANPFPAASQGSSLAGYQGPSLGNLLVRTATIALAHIAHYGEIFVRSFGETLAWAGPLAIVVFAYVCLVTKALIVALVIFVAFQFFGTLAACYANWTPYVEDAAPSAPPGLTSRPIPKNHLMDPRINQAHIKAKNTSIDIRGIPASIQLDTLLEIFKEIEFNDEAHPNYVPESWRKGECSFFLPAYLLEKYLKSFIDTVQGRYDAPLEGYIPTDPAEKEKFFQTIENAVRFALHTAIKDYDAFMQEQGGVIPDPKDAVNYQRYRDLFEAKARLVIDLAIAGPHCGQRYISEAIEAYDRARGEIGGEQGALAEVLEDLLQRARDRLARQHAEVYNPYERGNALRSHFMPTYLAQLGKELGLSGTEGVWGDRDINKAQLLRHFFNKNSQYPDLEVYNPEFIRKEVQERIKVGHRLQEVLRQGKEAKHRLESGEVRQISKVKELQDQVKAAQAVQNSPESQKLIAASNQLKNAISGWIKTQVGDWKKGEYQAKVPPLVKEIEALPMPSSSAAFSALEIFKKVLEGLGASRLPSLESWDEFVKELLALDSVKQFLNRELAPQGTQKDRMTARENWKQTLLHPVLAPELKKWTEAWISQPQATSLERLKPLCQALEWAKAIHPIIQKAGYPTINPESLARCLNGQVKLSHVIEAHLDCQRESEFLNEILRSDSDPHTEPALEVAQKGLSPVLLEWILVFQGIFNRP